LGWDGVIALHGSLGRTANRADGGRDFTNLSYVAAGVSRNQNERFRSGDRSEDRMIDRDGGERGAALLGEADRLRAGFEKGLTGFVGRGEARRGTNTFGRQDFRGSVLGSRH